jgi:pimeloyl-ACP methyl ester carboxylesterase
MYQPRENMMRNTLFLLTILFALIHELDALAQSQRVVDVESRTGVTQRFLLLQPADAKAAVILFAGGHGGLHMSADGTIKELRGNFLVRSRDLFVGQGLAVAVIDAPSDRQSFQYLTNFRQTPEHVADVKAAIAWLRQELKLPVWLIGTSRGTLSVAHIATQLAPADGGPDGVVLTSSILIVRGERPVPDMALEHIKVPVLVAHHKQDGCGSCLYSDLPKLTRKLVGVPKTELITFEGGDNIGNPCESRAYHGYNGIEAEVVGKLADWIKH